MVSIKIKVYISTFSSAVQLSLFSFISVLVSKMSSTQTNQVWLFSSFKQIFISSLRLFDSYSLIVCVCGFCAVFHILILLNEKLLQKGVFFFLFSYVYAKQQTNQLHKTN